MWKRLCCSSSLQSSDLKADKEMVHTYKLTYFPVRNLGEAIRLTFHYAGVKYEDFKIPLDLWPTQYKHKTPYGTVPLLEIDGCQLCESATILRFLGRKFAVSGTTPWEEAKVDEYIQVHLAEFNRIRPWLLAATGFEKGNVKELLESVGKPASQFYFTAWSKILKQNGTGYLVGHKPTPADFFLADYLHTVHNLAPQLFDNFSDLKHYTERIYGLPQLRNYIKSRPVSAL